MADSTPVWTWLPGSCEPVLAGSFELDGGRGRFSYETSYMQLENSRALDPVQLRFIRKQSGHSILGNNGFPGVILDAAPAGYGADRLKAKADRDLNTLELLAAGPPDGVGAIEVCQDIDSKLEWRPHPLDALLAHLKDLEEDAPSSRAIRRLNEVDGTSAGGERPKATVEHDGRLWLAKLQDRGDTPHLPAREFVVMRLARELGLQVPEVLLRTVDGREVYLIERFDRYGDPASPGRHLYASAYSVLGITEKTDRDDPRRSYLVLADNMRRWIVDVSHQERDLRELWLRMAFNALVGNKDDHPRNHGLIHTGEGWRLSPAFDITPLRSYSGLLSMATTAEGSKDASAENLIKACPRFGIAADQGARWLLDAAELISEFWEVRMVESGVSTVHLPDLRSAFMTAHAIHKDPDIVQMALESGHVGRRTRRRPSY
jgi:serine/threonine-protein kinase HipA